MNTRSTAIFTATDNMSHSLLSPFLSAKRWISLPQKYDTTALTAIGIIPHVDTHRHSTTVPSRNTAFLKRTPDKAYTPIKTGRKKYKNSRLTNAILLVFIVFCGQFLYECLQAFFIKHCVQHFKQCVCSELFGQRQFFAHKLSEPAAIGSAA